jgi:hypothetical protein
MEDEMSRIQMIKEQIIIYFSLSKRYNLDEIELPREKLKLTSTYNIKMVQFEIDIKVNQLE